MNSKRRHEIFVEKLTNYCRKSDRMKRANKATKLNED